MRLSFELIPKDKEHIIKQLKTIEKLNFFDSINVPDIAKFKIRSWEVEGLEKYNYIPHLRAIDFDLTKKTLFKLLKKRKLKHVLIIKGDPSNDPAIIRYNTTVLSMIKEIKALDSSIVVYAAFDPYRQSLSAEIDNMKEKLEAGADYLMSQPFFDINLIKVFTNFIDPSKLFIGVSPVVSEKSKLYWENVNKVSFPKNFKTTYDWNINFAKEVLNFAYSKDINLYFMPIGVNLDRYLTFTQE